MEEFTYISSGEEDEYVLVEQVRVQPPSESHRLRPPPTNDVDYTFKYLDESYSIKEVIERVLPPSAVGKQIMRMKIGEMSANLGAQEKARKWYEMWFYLTNPKSTFLEQYNACVAALNEWDEPKGYIIHPDLINLELLASDMVKKRRRYYAKTESKKYGIPMRHLVAPVHSDGKDRSNPSKDPEQFYYSYLRTTIESMDVDTSTKVGTSRNPICKVIYKQNEWLPSEGNRSTDPMKYKLELFIGPFCSEDDSREFNSLWKDRRGAQPRRLFAQKYAKDRQMICVDMRSVQPVKFIDDLRRKKKAKKTVSF